MTSCFLRLHIESILFTNNMKWSPIIIVIGFICTIKSVAGYATMKADCMKPGVKEKNTGVSCTISGKIEEGMLWLRPDGQNVAICNMENTHCVTVSGEFNGRYTAVALTPFSTTLLIESFDPNADVGQWSCADSYKGVKSTCYKHVIPQLTAASGASVRVISTFVLIFWVTAILATGLQVTTNMFPI